MPDATFLEMQFADRFEAAYASQFGSHREFARATVYVDAVRFTLNRSTGYVSRRNALIQPAAQKSIAGLAVFRVNSRRAGKDPVELALPVEGRIEILTNWTLTGRFLEQLEKYGEHRLAANVRSGGITFPASRPFWPETRSLSVSDAHRHLRSRQTAVR
jgi:hypothetical protein